MKAGEELLKLLNKTYATSTTVELRFKGYDVSLITDAEGRAILAFVGKRNEIGTIKGDRYARKLIFDREGKLIKDHWERKGKAS